MDKKVIHSVINNIAERFPESVAVNDNSVNFSYKQLSNFSDIIKEKLYQLNIPSQSIIGVFIDISFEYIFSIIGVLKAGSVFMPLNDSIPEKRLLLIIRKTYPKVIITSRKNFEKAEKLSDIVLVIEEDYQINIVNKKNITFENSNREAVTGDSNC